MPNISEELFAFVEEYLFRGKGSLSVALVVTQHAKASGLPFDPEKLLTARSGQILGQGKGAVQAVLKRHGIERVLADEGGRTSRGSLQKMRDYVALLNRMQSNGTVDLDAIESFWIDRVHEFFAGKPFKVKLDAARSLRTVVRDVIQQAQARQKTVPGVYYTGAVLQHLVGAKLGCALGHESIEHNSFSTADAPKARHGDFLIGDVTIHVTTSPGEAVIKKCAGNLDDGYKPILITLQKGIPVAEGLSANFGIAERIDIFEVEQFVALNLYEWGKFRAEGRRIAVSTLVNCYNEIVEDVETDPSLKIELRP